MYTGVTGFTERQQVEEILKDYSSERKLMVGVLTTKKTLYGASSVRYPHRYPKVQDINSIFTTDTNCLNLVHYSTSHETTKDDLDLLIKYAGVKCQGFQFNGTWPKRSLLEPLVASGYTIVLQCRPHGDQVPHYYIGAATHLLFDGSGGKGLPCDLKQAFQFWRVHFQLGFSIGIAGGFHESFLPDSDFLPKINIDAEGKLRNTDDTWNSEKVKAYLNAVT